MQKIKKILVSQPKPAIIEKSQFFDLSQKFSLTVDYQPFIQVKGINEREFRSQKIEIKDYTAIIFTSRTTVDIFFKICDETRTQLPESMRYLCHTEAIALYMQKYMTYRKRKIMFADGTYKGMMELILKFKDEKFLLALTEPYNNEIPQTLEKLKLKFSKLVLAHTVSNDLSAVDPGNYDMMLFYSPSEIQALTTAFTDIKLPCVATFGAGTTRKAIESGLDVFVMAPTPEAPSMSKALELFLVKLAAGETPTQVTIDEDRKAEEFVKAHQTKTAKAIRRNKKTTSGTSPAGIKRG